MGYKIFAERLNKSLDELGVPEQNEERLQIFMKLLKISRFKAEAFLSGTALPDPLIIDTIAQELEVSAKWLLGQENQP